MYFHRNRNTNSSIAVTQSNLVLILAISLINENEIAIVHIDKLITTPNKDIPNKKQRADSTTTFALINKVRNDSI